MKQAPRWAIRERLYRVRPFIETSGRRDYGIDLVERHNRTIYMVMIRNHFVFSFSRTWLNVYVRKATTKRQFQMLVYGVAHD